MPLKRTLNLPLLTFYGLGSIIGAGIYALIGSVMKEAQLFTPLSFFIAALIAIFTAATYAELSSRFPESAGASLYIKKAFNHAALSGLVGWLVVATGIVSSGALTHGLINYLQLYLPLSSFFLIPLVILVLGSITLFGITESAITIFIMTSLEILGLLIIIWYGKSHVVQATQNINQFFPSFTLTAWLPIISGAFLAFYAFIGFEDMVNVAEETKHPEKNMPLAIFLAAIFASVLYIAISFITVISFNPAELLEIKTPLSALIAQQGHSPFLFSIIAMISIANGILVNIIMASRLLYGMTKLKSAPILFSKIYKKTQIPIFATLFVMFIVMVLSYLAPIDALAKITSTIMLVIFCSMHLSLIVIKIKYESNTKHVDFPIFVPFIGLILSLTFFIFSLILDSVVFYLVAFYQMHHEML